MDFDILIVRESVHALDNDVDNDFINDSFNNSPNPSNPLSKLKKNGNPI